MRQLLTLITLLVALNSYSQSMGDSVSVLLNDSTISFYGFKDNYGEFVQLSDTCILSYIVAYKHNIIVGIDYLHPSRESALKGLKIRFKDICEIGDGVFLKGDLLIVLKGCDILTRDVRYFNREFTELYISR